MNDIVNLNRYRKARERSEKAKQAKANRARFGRPKHERLASDRQRASDDAEHAGKRLEDDAAPGDGPDGG